MRGLQAKPEALSPETPVAETLGTGTLSAAPNTRMSRSSSGHGGTWLTIASLAVLFYGAEHWRRRAARRASAVETQRFENPGGVRPRGRRGRLDLRARRDATTAAGAGDADLARSRGDVARPVRSDGAAAGGARDGGGLGQLTRAPSHVEMRATELARALARVGLVWQVRAGESAVDMDRIADLFAATAAEVGIAHGARFQTRKTPWRQWFLRRSRRCVSRWRGSRRWWRAGQRAFWWARRCRW